MTEQTQATVQTHEAMWREAFAQYAELQGDSVVTALEELGYSDAKMTDMGLDMQTIRKNEAEL